LTIGTDISSRIIFPYAPNEANGIEDARFVRFTEDDGTTCYYATYTAYDGNVVLPQILETRDFQEFAISDSASRFATVRVRDLLDAMQPVQA
jgi:predicted GH43/DUF377 family glycosyl hydrolase